MRHTTSSAGRFLNAGNSEIDPLPILAAAGAHVSGIRKTSSAEGPTALPIVGAIPEGEATDFVAFAPAVVFLLPFLAQKSHVKSKNHLTH